MNYGGPVFGGGVPAQHPNPGFALGLAHIIHSLLGGGAPFGGVPQQHGSLADFLQGRATGDLAGGGVPHAAPPIFNAGIPQGDLGGHHVAPPVRMGPGIGNPSVPPAPGFIEHLLQMIHNLNPPLAQPLPNSVPPVAPVQPPHRQVPNPGTGLM